MEQNLMRRALAGNPRKCTAAGRKILVAGFRDFLQFDSGLQSDVVLLSDEAVGPAPQAVRRIRNAQPMIAVLAARLSPMSVKSSLHLAACALGSTGFTWLFTAVLS